MAHPHLWQWLHRQRRRRYRRRRHRCNQWRSQKWCYRRGKPRRSRHDRFHPRIGRGREIMVHHKRTTKSYYRLHLRIGRGREITVHLHAFRPQGESCRIHMAHQNLLRLRQHQRPQNLYFLSRSLTAMSPRRIWMAKARCLTTRRTQRRNTVTSTTAATSRRTRSCSGKVHVRVMSTIS